MARIYEAGDNFGNTFRIEEGMIKVRYDQYGNYTRPLFESDFTHFQKDEWVKAELIVLGDSLITHDHWRYGIAIQQTNDGRWSGIRI